MARYTVFINGQRYRISMSDVSDYYYQDENPIEDIIHYEVEWEEGDSNGTIYAWIENPSQHTLHLIEQGRCYLCLNKKMTHKWSRYRGRNSYGPDYSRFGWQRGLQRQNHPYWKAGTVFVPITDVENIVLSFPADEWNYSNVWYLNDVSNYFEDPLRTEYYIEFKPILVSTGIHEPYQCSPCVRPYQTKTKVTRLTIQRE